MASDESDAPTTVAGATPVLGTTDTTASGKVSAGSARGRELRPPVRKMQIHAGGGVGEHARDKDLDEDEDGKSVASTGSGLRVCLQHLVIIPCCCLCHDAAGEQSPLRGAHSDDKYGGLKPWAEYTNGRLQVSQGKALPDLHECLFHHWIRC